MDLTNKKYIDFTFIILAMCVIVYSIMTIMLFLVEMYFFGFVSLFLTFKCWESLDEVSEKIMKDYYKSLKIEKKEKMKKAIKKLRER